MEWLLHTCMPIPCARARAGEVSIVAGDFHEEGKQKEPAYKRIGIRELADGASTVSMHACMNAAMLRSGDAAPCFDSHM